MQNILELLERRPDIAAINAQYAGDGWYRRHTDELRTMY
jgi:spore coat polysaccharide biosynthesis protein SpsF